MLKPKFESLTIKKDCKDKYHLYGLVWWIIDNKKTLVCIKSNNMIWDFNIKMSSEFDRIYTNKYGSETELFSYLSKRYIFTELNFKNIEDAETKILYELKILNGKEDEFMNYNIYEGLDNYIVKINVAGVDKKDIRLTLEDEIVKVKINPKNSDLGEDYEIVEENFKPEKQECEIYLPNIINVEAKYENGILVLTAPKENKAVKIEIK